MKRLSLIALLLCAMPAWAQHAMTHGPTLRVDSLVLPPARAHAMMFAPQTWYVRADGGPSYYVGLAGDSCDGKADTALVVSAGANQSCAFNDFRYLYSNNNSTALAWKMVGGDTAIVRGCHALPGQSNPSNPACRIGSDNANDNNSWCGPFGTSSNNCYPPQIPAGTSGAHTRFLSTCAAAGNCQIGSETNPKLYASNLTQLFGGFALFITLDFANTQYVDFEGFEFTAHNGACSTLGSPELGGGCATSQPYSDYANYGIRTNNTSANITFQDDYIHGFNASGLWGPIGGLINMLRTFVGFNAFAGWNFDDGSGTPDAAGSALNWTHTIWEGNGCQEEYPIVDSFPAVRCWDDGSGGFGDAISGQGGAGMGSILTSLYMNDYQAILNTKDGFIGPHVCPTTMTIINSVSAFNMGEQWKWGACVGTAQTLLFENNLTVSGGARMSAAMSPGPFGLTAPTGYNTYLGDFNRGGGVISSVISAGSNWMIANSTFISPGLGMVVLNSSCPTGTSGCTSNIHWYNIVLLTYPNIPPVSFGGSSQTLFYNVTNPSDITIDCDHEVEYGGGLVGNCVTDPTINVTAGAGVIFTDPFLLNEPPQSATAQSALDVFTLAQGSTSFTPTGSSPMLSTGTTPAPATDYFGVTQTSPPTIGAVVQSGTPTAATPTFSPGVPYTGTATTVTLASATFDAVICYTTDGSTPAAATPGTCSAGTTYSGPFAVATTTTVKALATETAFLNSGVAVGLYTIVAPTPPNIGGSGNLQLSGCVSTGGAANPCP